MNVEPYHVEPLANLTDPATCDRYRAAIDQVVSELGRDYPLVLHGQEETTGEWLASLNPANPAEVVGRVPKAKPAEIGRAMEGAWSAYETWSRFTMAARSRVLLRLAAIMRHRRFELAAWEIFEASKNHAEADADVCEAIDFVEYYAREALRLAEPLPTHSYPGEDNESFLQPIGVGVVIPPWNFPLAILTGMSIGPVAVGNAVIVKPAPDTPIIAAKWMECVEEAGFPPGVINYLTGDDDDIGDALVDHPHTRFINFTGSRATGCRINERAAKVQPGQRWLKKVFLEMGGKDALIVDETADQDASVQFAVKSGYGFQGQKCSAMSRLVLVDAIHDEFLEQFVEKVRALRVGPAVDNPDVAALINEKALEKSLHYIAQGKEEARLVLGGERGPEPGYFVLPTVFADVPPAATIAREEIFGPIVSVLRARDFDHALEIVNDSDYALTGGVASRNRVRLERARREFQAGNLYFNRKITGALVGIQPFGGFLMSGTNAKAGGPDYLRLFMEMKTVTERL